MINLIIVEALISMTSLLNLLFEKSIINISNMAPEKDEQNHEDDHFPEPVSVALYVIIALSFFGVLILVMGSVMN